jgi:serine protease Do
MSSAILTLAFVCLQGTQHPVPAPDEVIHLGEGRKAVGRVIKETEEAIYLDVGFDVVRIPRPSVVRREVASLAPVAADGVVREDVFSRAELPEVSIAEGVTRVGEAVVKIESGSGQGSGFITSPDGYVVTNFHVVEREVEVKVTLYLRSLNGFDLRTIRQVKVVAINPDMDLALLKMDPPADIVLKNVFLGDSEKVRAGDRVYAIGTPIGLERTVSAGIVSVTNRTFAGRTHFQITAAINPGNSGGPLFDLRGQVVGVNSAKIVGIGVEGLNFAIPSKYVIDFLRNRDAFALDSTRSENGIHYLPAPRKPRPESRKQDKQ